MQVQKVSRASAVFVFWSRAVYEYALVCQEKLLPKRQQAEKLRAVLQSEEFEEFDKSVSEKKNLQGTVSIGTLLPRIY